MSENRYRLVQKMSTKKQILYGLAASFTLFLILGAYKFFQIRSAMAAGEKMGPPPQAVSTIVLKKEVWHPHIETFARVEPINGALIKSESSGRIVKINFTDGSYVEKDQILLELDSSIEMAEYLSAKAKAELASKTFQRQSILFKQKAISQDEYDTARLNFQALDSAANATKSILNKKILTAPFSGKIGVRRINIGQYVREGDDLYQLQDDKNIYLSITLGERDASRLQVGDNITFTLSDTKTDYKDKIDAIDPNLSTNSGTKMMKATFVDSHDNITIGSFGKASIELNESVDAFIVPASGIQYAPYGNSLFIVRESLTTDGGKIAIADPTFIKIFDQRGDMVAITEGLNVSDQIVTSGTFKLMKGTKLIINNQLPENSSLTPNPKNS